MNLISGYIFLFLAIILCKPLLFMLDQPKNVVNLAIPYLEIVAASLIPLLMFQALKQYSDGLSLTSNPMYATVLANMINVVVYYILIFGKFGFPAMGIIGAAIGTLVSRIIMFSFLLLVIQAKPCCLISNLNLLFPEVAKTELFLLNS